MKNQWTRETRKVIRENCDRTKRTLGEESVMLGRNRKKIDHEKSTGTVGTSKELSGGGRLCKMVVKKTMRNYEGNWGTSSSNPYAEFLVWASTKNGEGLCIYFGAIFRGLMSWEKSCKSEKVVSNVGFEGRWQFFFIGRGTFSKMAAQGVYCYKWNIRLILDSFRND